MEQAAEAAAAVSPTITTLRGDIDLGPALMLFFLYHCTFCAPTVEDGALKCPTQVFNVLRCEST